MAAAKGIPQIADSLADFHLQTLETLDKRDFVTLFKILAIIAFLHRLLIADMVFKKKSEVRSKATFHVILLPSMIHCYKIKMT